MRFELNSNLNHSNVLLLWTTIKIYISSGRDEERERERINLIQLNETDRRDHNDKSVLQFDPAHQLCVELFKGL